MNSIMNLVEQQRLHEVTKALVEERTRIGRNLHDGPMQTVAYIALKLEYIHALLENNALHDAQAELQRIRADVATCVDMFRHDITTLLSGETDTLCGKEQLQNLLAEYKMSAPALQVSWEIGELDGLPLQCEESLFQVVREALNNVRKHAHATHVAVRVFLEATSCIVEICDDGVGLQSGYVEWLCSKQTSQHLGIRILHERVHAVGGTITFLGNAGHGTCIRAIFPFSVV